MPAQFPVDLNLPPPGQETSITDAQKAVRDEFRGCSEWKLLRCHKYSLIAERERGSIYVLDVGHSVEFDWTWEGATAFCPETISDKLNPSSDYFKADYDCAIRWSGEILEVDEQNGCLFIGLDNENARPDTGPFFVRPFEFLAGLEALYHHEKFDLIRKTLPERLNASLGSIHPRFSDMRPAGLPKLTNWWQHNWSILWGPPGTGKTFQSGRQIASAMRDENERILVVSTTNRATDAIALTIGEAAREFCPKLLTDGQLLRIGKGASPQAYEQKCLGVMLEGSNKESMMQVDDLNHQLQIHNDSDDRALTRKQISEIKSISDDQSHQIFMDPEIRTVVATSFKAMCFLNDEWVRSIIEKGNAPFTTIFIDEAGLISRAAVAALSLFASGRVVLVGDSRQLAPISKISRLLPTRQKKWIASSGLSHLDDIATTPSGVHVLLEQHRMHPKVCEMVSSFHYNNRLTTSLDTNDRKSNLPASIADQSRSIWYVLDEECHNLSEIRAEKGPNNQSWIRKVTRQIIKKLLTDPEVHSANGIFVSPYRAQTLEISKLFTQLDTKNWEASTVHSQQGSEADIVIFDTVCAGSCHWPHEEWKRLVNVGLSRAREAVILIASRSEMEEPHLQPLLKNLYPAILESGKWKKVSLNPLEKNISREISAPNQASDSMGHQIAQRKQMTPIMSKEQERLCELEFDGKARLVRGVAGSGKSYVLSNWLAKTVSRKLDEPDFRVWAIYANRSLHSLLRDCVESAWDHYSSNEFPWNRADLLHIKDVLEGILPGAGLSLNEYDYDSAAEEFLNRQDFDTNVPRCDALFIDEAQDMGPSMLKLLVSMVKPSDPEHEQTRPVHIFYDNAQNLYDRGTPNWSELGVDIRGRSTIMKESFRSTQPITEFAINVVERLSRRTKSPDLEELITLKLVERRQYGKEEWLHVTFNQVNGPKPIFRCYQSIDQEVAAIAQHLKYLIVTEGISPNDICLIYNHKSVAQTLKSHLAPLLTEFGVELSVQTSQKFMRKPNTLIVTTTHSFKGYEAEVVLIPCADKFVAKDRILANNLFVAMTRARSLLAVYSSENSSSLTGEINAVFQECSTMPESKFKIT